MNGFTKELPVGFTNNYHQWYLVISPPIPDATTQFTFADGTKSAPQPDWYARAGAMILVPGAGLTDYARRNEMGGNWMWIPAEEAHARLHGFSREDGEALRQLQQKLAAAKAVIAHVHEYTRDNS